ncbi:hypothetical protein RND71_000498 [Anisodus tanguticus]|uniref:DOG1 domain-containing protein n=1 Tax=Anisodus tanguticus TaxID=243964 RepID=A0AAE1T1C5_9SOLA|nr:hypothetical protein RND71_000498 [Anisodus tanguticus]
MLNPSWRSNLEGAFLWIGGWRPSMTFHLLYSKSGWQLEARLPELIKGIRTGDLGDLKPSQVGKVDELHKKTIREEKDSSENLSDMFKKLLQRHQWWSNPMEEQVEDNLANKEEGLVIILQKADNLRLNTLKEILAILTPTQALHFLIAAAELHLRLHEWGKKKDAVTLHHTQP